MEYYYSVHWFLNEEDGTSKFEKRYAIYNCFFGSNALVLRNPNMVRRPKEVEFEYPYIQSVELMAYPNNSITRRCYYLELIIHTTDLRIHHLDAFPFPKYVPIIDTFRQHGIEVVDPFNLLPIIQNEGYTELFNAYMDEHFDEFNEKYHLIRSRKSNLGI